MEPVNAMKLKNNRRGEAEFEDKPDEFELGVMASGELKTSSVEMIPAICVQELPRAAVPNNNSIHSDCLPEVERNISCRKDQDGSPSADHYSTRELGVEIPPEHRQGDFPVKAYETSFSQRLRGIHKIKKSQRFHEKFLPTITRQSGSDICHFPVLENSIVSKNKSFPCKGSLRQIQEQVSRRFKAGEKEEAATQCFDQDFEHNGGLNVSACQIDAKRYSEKIRSWNKLPRILQERSLASVSKEAKNDINKTRSEKINGQNQLPRISKEEQNLSSVSKEAKNDFTIKYPEKIHGRNELPRISKDRNSSSVSKKAKNDFTKKEKVHGRNELSRISQQEHKSSCLSEVGLSKTKKNSGRGKLKDCWLVTKTKSVDPLEEIRTTLRRRRHRAGLLPVEKADDTSPEMSDVESIFRFTTFVCPGGFLYFVPGILAFKHSDYDRWSRKTTEICLEALQ